MSRDPRKLLGQSPRALPFQSADLAVARNVIERRGGFGFEQEADQRQVLLEIDGRHRHAGLFQVGERLVVESLLGP